MRQWMKRFYPLGVVLGGLIMLRQLSVGFRSYQEHKPTLASLSILLIGIIPLLAGTALQLNTWFIIIKQYDRRMDWIESSNGYLVSFLPRFIPGSIWGYISRAHWYFERYNIPLANTNVGSIIETAGGCISILLINIIFWFPQLSSWTRMLLILLPILLGAAALIVVKRQIQADWMQRLVPHAKDADTFLRTSWASFCMTIFLTSCRWLLIGISLGIIRSSIGQITLTLNAQHWVGLGAIFSLSWFAGFIVPFVPSGLGIREITLSSLLISVFQWQVAEATIVPVLARGLITIVEGLWMVFLSAILGIHARQRRNRT